MKLAFRLLLILLPLGGMAQTPQDSLRVLWVGNSFSYCNDLPGMVQKIASTQKVKLSCTRFLKGGERFSGHLKNKKLLQAIADGGWDYVVLQEQSAAPDLDRWPARSIPRPGRSTVWCMPRRPTPG